MKAISVLNSTQTAAGMAVRDAREEVGPGQRAGIGVGHVDLELRHHYEDRRRSHGPAVAREHVLIRREVHLVGVHGAIGRHHVSDGQVGQQGPAQHLDHPQHHPARAAGQHAQPPGPAIGLGARRHEAQVVGLLAHLRDEGDAHRQCGTKQVQLKAAGLALVTNVVRDT
jgi:hypothetical protein